MTVELGNIWHLFWIFAYIVFAIACCLIIRKYSKEKQKKIIYAMMLINLVIHFVAPFLPWDIRDLPIMRIFIVNICAGIVVLGPIFFFFKDNFIKKGFVYAAIFAGVVSALNPSDTIGNFAFSFSTIRFFIQHILIFTTSVLLISAGHVKLQFRNIWTFPIFMFACLLLVVANLYILEKLGVINSMMNFNAAFQWRPADIEGLVSWLIPGFLRTYRDGVHDFVPILWQLPVFLIIYPIFAIVVNVVIILVKRLTQKEV